MGFNYVDDGSLIPNFSQSAEKNHTTPKPTNHQQQQKNHKKEKPTPNNPRKNNTKSTSHCKHPNSPLFCYTPYAGLPRIIHFIPLRLSK